MVPFKTWLGGWQRKYSLLNEDVFRGTSRPRRADSVGLFDELVRTVYHEALHSAQDLSEEAAEKEDVGLGQAIQAARSTAAVGCCLSGRAGGGVPITTRLERFYCVCGVPYWGVRA
jgi:hypothetical protein